VVPTLKTLKGRGFRIGLISNCDGTLPVVWPAMALAALIDVPIFSCMEGLKKPDTAIYQAAITRLGVRPDACIFIGDGSNDELTGAQAAGMAAVQLLVANEDPEVARWLRRQQWDSTVVTSPEDVVRLVL
jgi:putative hydrolase of the HAD superfamily